MFLKIIKGGHYGGGWWREGQKTEGATDGAGTEGINASPAAAPAPVPASAETGSIKFN